MPYDGVEVPDELVNKYNTEEGAIIGMVTESTSDNHSLILSLKNTAPPSNACSSSLSSGSVNLLNTPSFSEGELSVDFHINVPWNNQYAYPTNIRTEPLDLGTYGSFVIYSVIPGCKQLQVYGTVVASRTAEQPVLRNCLAFYEGSRVAPFMYLTASYDLTTESFTLSANTEGHSNSKTIR